MPSSAVTNKTLFEDALAILLILIILSNAKISQTFTLYDNDLRADNCGRHTKARTNTDVLSWIYSELLLVPNSTSGLFHVGIIARWLVHNSNNDIKSGASTIVIRK